MLLATRQLPPPIRDHRPAADREGSPQPDATDGRAANLDPLPKPQPVVDIVIPVYNEEDDLAPSVRKLRAYLDRAFPFDTRITIADNASTDRTWLVATRRNTPVNGPQFGWFDESRVRHHHRMQGAIERFAPEIEKSLQFGEFRAEIVLLPDIGLEQPGVIGAPVEDMRRRQPVSGELTLEVTAGHLVLQIRLGDSNSRARDRSIASLKSE